MAAQFNIPVMLTSPNCFGFQQSVYYIHNETKFQTCHDTVRVLHNNRVLTEVRHSRRITFWFTLTKHQST